jgi:cof-like hydrolase
MYKAIFLDMDGTLLNSKKEISNKTKEILLKIYRSGIEIILISGRSNKSIEYIVKNRINNEHMLVRYIISTDGIMIKDLQENKVIYQSDMKKEIVEKLVSKSKQFDTAFYLITENNMYKDDRLNQYQNEIDAWYVNGEFYGINDNLKKVDFNKLNLDKEKVNRILFFSKDYESLKRINDEIKHDKNIKTLFRKDYHDYQLLLVSNEYSKAMGVIQMCKYLNVQLNDTMAFGDADNDIEMLSVVKNGIAMKNAKCDLKTKSVTKFTNNEDGVARFLDDMIKNGELICMD